MPVRSVESPAPGLRTGAIRITPDGALRLEGEAAAAGISEAAWTALRSACAAGAPDGLLHLGVTLADRPLPSELRFFSGFAHEFAARALQLTGDSAEITLPAELDGGETQRWLARVPPVEGAEYLSEKRLRQWWAGMGEALAAALQDSGFTLARWLPAQSGGWAKLGRVHLHLAENKNHPVFPFAFLATYTVRLDERAQPLHLPLSKALGEFAGAGHRKALLNLLRPLHAAAERLPWLRRMVEEKTIFRPTGLSADGAHRFLASIPELEAAGLRCRVPDWWNAARRPRLQVRVTIGGAAPATLGAAALVDFNAGLALGDEAITEREWRALIKQEGSFVQLRGQWVEIDRDRLRQLLALWDARGARGVTLAEGLRMMAGMSGPAAEGAEAADGAPAWSRVEGGAWLRETLATLRDPARLAGGADGEEGVAAQLRHYQRAGAGWLDFLAGLRLGACLADDMGLGKTLQVLVLISRLKRRTPRRGPHLLVAPASLLANWRAEAARFAPGLSLLIAHPSVTPAAELAGMDGERIRGADLVVTTYGSAGRLPWIRNTEWDLIILDEAQAIKNPGAAQTRAVKALRAASRIALTGTPVENRLGDLWSLFDFLNPGLLGGRSEFTRAVKRMAAAPEGYAPLRRLVAPYILRRLKSDPAIIRDLPPKTEVETFCLLSRKQAALYSRAVAALAKALEGAEGIARRGLVLSTLLRLKQICNHPAQWQGHGEYAPEESGKFTRLSELAAEIASRQEKALVFTQFRELTAPLAGCLTRVMGREGLTLDGATPLKQRAERVARFQDDDRLGFMVLSLKAGGVGLNLTAARHVIHFDRWWNPAVENQATDRAFRIGQKHPVLVNKLVCKGTLEEKIAAMIAGKRALADAVVGGGGEAMLTEMGDAELLRTVALDLESATAA